MDQVPAPTYLAQPYDTHIHEPLKVRHENVLKEHACLQSAIVRKKLDDIGFIPENRGQSSSSAAPAIVVEEACSHAMGEDWSQAIGEDCSQAMGEDCSQAMEKDCSQDTEKDGSQANTLDRWALDEGL